MISRPDPVARVNFYMRALRIRHIMGRTLFILSIALTTELVYNLFAIALYNLWYFKINLPFLFEILFLVLLAREIPGWRSERLASRLDQKFALKDRLYSFTWYSRGKRVPHDIRQAQAENSLAAIEFSGLMKRTRMKFPLYLSAVTAITLAMIYIIGNSPYRPTGITTRILSKIQSYDHSLPFKGLLSEEAGPVNGQPEEVASAGDPGEPRGKENAGSEDSEQQGSVKGPGNEGTSVPEDAPIGEEAMKGETSVVDGTAGTGGFSGGDQPGINGISPAIQSVPETETVSEPVPPLLKNSSSFAYRKLPDAIKFLSLIPGQGDLSLAPLDSDTVSNFKEGIDRFPELYRDHLETYYRELQKWDKRP